MKKFVVGLDDDGCSFMLDGFKGTGLNDKSSDAGRWGVEISDGATQMTTQVYKSHDSTKGQVKPPFVLPML